MLVFHRAEIREHEPVLVQAWMRVLRELVVR